MHVAQMMTTGCPVPQGAILFGWIDRHPTDKHGSGYGVLRLKTGIEVAWTGVSIRSLPRNWRDKVAFEAVG